MADYLLIFILIVALPMIGKQCFIDTNVLLYLLSEDARKADLAERLLSGSQISVQVLNEIANVARRKLNMSWAEINEFLNLIRSLCSVQPLSIETHEHGCAIAERYGLSLYDAMIVAAAILADCQILYSEDMQHGLHIYEQLQIQNPFVEA